MKKLVIPIIIVTFLLGWYSNFVYSNISSEKPSSLFSLDLNSPSDIIKEDQIYVFKDKIVINIKNATLASYADTNSMDPLLDIGANGIEIIPESEDQINVGDVVAYESKFSKGLIVHRVFEKNQDENGTYFRLKGDNNSFKDPEKVRFSQIEYQLIGVLY